MKRSKKTKSGKSGASHRRKRNSHPNEPLQPKFSQSQEEDRPETFTAMETGQPDHQEGRGPLGEEGEGDRQNDQLAELNEIEPEEE